jgi:hypothetical protein
MTAQVIFLNKWLDCPEEVRQRHRLMQEYIQGKKAEYDNETRNYSPFQKTVARQRSNNLLRNSLKLLKSEDFTTH